MYDLIPSLIMHKPTTDSPANSLQETPTLTALCSNPFSKYKVFRAPTGSSYFWGRIREVCLVCLDGIQLCCHSSSSLIGEHFLQRVLYQFLLCWSSIRTGTPTQIGRAVALLEADLGVTLSLVQTNVNRMTIMCIIIKQSLSRLGGSNCCWAVL